MLSIDGRCKLFLLLNSPISPAILSTIRRVAPNIWGTRAVNWCEFAKTQRYQIPIRYQSNHHFLPFYHILPTISLGFSPWIFPWISRPLRATKALPRPAHQRAAVGVGCDIACPNPCDIQGWGFCWEFFLTGNHGFLPSFPMDPSITGLV